MDMNEENMDRVKELSELALQTHTTVVLAISGSKKSKYILNWALEKFIPEGLMFFELLHVRPLISRIPSPTGNYIPISQAPKEMADAVRKDVECQVNEKLLPYKKMCSQRKVEVEIVQIESGDVGSAITGYIQKHAISKLVIGASSRSMFSTAQTLSTRIQKCCLDFCNVYVVSKGKLFAMHLLDSVTNRSFEDDSSETSFSTDNSLRSQMHPGNSSSDTNGSDLNYAESSFSKSSTHTSPMIQTSTSDASVINQANVDLELEKMRIELRHIRSMYAIAQGEAIDASRKLNEIEKRRLAEEANLKQISYMEEVAEELANQEKTRYEAAKREADYVKECAGREAVERKEAEIIASRETKKKENMETKLKGCVDHYRRFTWEEIESATSSFSDSLKIGMGAHGAVYRCSFQHTTAAVKILHAKEVISGGDNQFQQELEMLSQIHHPHILILLGACPERSCLVYEYMENGSLEDCLTNKNNTPLLWFDRFRIAWEVASALIFLHETKPKSIIHRDLKPSNILLDRNHVSKIGDVALSSFANNGLVGTLCYIDPEYQRTGVVSTESDVYAFGMIVLQLLTAKPAIALAHVVENAVNDNCLSEVLDLEGGEWPTEETNELAGLGLKCTELRRMDRPDLRDEVLPALKVLKEFAERAKKSRPPVAPKHFMCPIIKEVMVDPCVAADGYTYERRAMEGWIEKNDVSPVTGVRLVHKYLTPNYTLLSAIMEWKSGKETMT